MLLRDGMIFIGQKIKIQLFSSETFLPDQD